MTFVFLGLSKTMILRSTGCTQSIQRQHSTSLSPFLPAVLGHINLSWILRTPWHPQLTEITQVLNITLLPPCQLCDLANKQISATTKVDVRRSLKHELIFSVGNQGVSRSFKEVEQVALQFAPENWRFKEGLSPKRVSKADVRCSIQAS